MSVKDRIKARVDDSVIKSYYKPWYKRWWGRVIIFFATLIILSLLLLAYKLVNSFIHIQRGEFFDSNIGIWLSEEQYTQNQKFAADLLTDDDPWLGAEKPLINVIAYESFGCPFCRENQADLKKMLANFGGLVRFTTKDFPTEGLHPGALEAHLAAACAKEQGRFWEYHDILYAKQKEFTRDELKVWAKDLGLVMPDFEKCLDSDKYNQEIKQDYAMGAQAGVIGTPTYVINGNLIPGVIKYEVWEQIVAFIVKGEF